jgi:hypothetical protein
MFLGAMESGEQRALAAEAGTRTATPSIRGAYRDVESSAD